ncbi:hypothetical protein SAMN05216284_11446 [Micromonospora sediminimaris]|nr:hypothetical protein SAMN05216284_11446 [Micromonospora sediminimaris]
MALRSYRSCATITGDWCRHWESYPGCSPMMAPSVTPRIRLCRAESDYDDAASAAIRICRRAGGVACGAPSVVAEDLANRDAEHGRHLRCLVGRQPATAWIANLKFESRKGGWPVVLQVVERNGGAAARCHSVQCCKASGIGIVHALLPPVGVQRSRADRAADCLEVDALVDERNLGVPAGDQLSRTRTHRRDDLGRSIRGVLGRHPIWHGRHDTKETFAHAHILYQLTPSRYPHMPLMGRREEVDLVGPRARMVLQS